MFFPAPKNFPSGTVQNDSCPEYIYVSKLATMDKGGYVGPEIRVGSSVCALITPPAF